MRPIRASASPSCLARARWASGSLFDDAKNLEAHTGIVDIAPTILHGLGIPAPQTMEGRVLREAFANGAIEPPGSVPETFETGAGPYKQVLHRTRIGDSCYLDGGLRSA